MGLGEEGHARPGRTANQDRTNLTRAAKVRGEVSGNGGEELKRVDVGYEGQPGDKSQADEVVVPQYEYLYVRDEGGNHSGRLRAHRSHKTMK
jgi:hypothetical protein